MHLTRRLIGAAIGTAAACAVTVPATATPTTATQSGVAGPSIVRLAGQDRYETAVKVSTYLNPAPVPDDEVTIVSGTAWPDALAAANLYQTSRAVLLVQRNRVPEVTLREIKRLTPRRIVVVGGTGVIDSSVVRLLDPLAPEGAHRIAGRDRYKTTAAVVDSVFWGEEMMPIFHMVLATGENWPDALTGAALGGPLLLTKRDTLPWAAIYAARGDSVIGVGGTGAISNDVLNNYYLGNRDRSRIGGPDRYATAAKVAVADDPDVSTVWYASGENYPDALAASGVRAVVLLTRAACVPRVTDQATRDLAPERIVVLGGPSVANTSRVCRS
ncbi:cell wall-binding repeat-containing protein [Intrasporangium sp.]|uniref:cell wall-binding repeat-containing protein n=1 Tax=Intrasporangium sp. TaxID=1925024 RepID=UPI003221E258